MARYRTSLSVLAKQSLSLLRRAIRGIDRAIYHGSVNKRPITPRDLRHLAKVALDISQFLALSGYRLEELAKGRPEEPADEKRIGQIVRLYDQAEALLAEIGEREDADEATG